MEPESSVSIRRGSVGGYNARVEDRSHPSHSDWCNKPRKAQTFVKTAGELPKEVSNPKVLSGARRFR